MKFFQPICTSGAKENLLKFLVAAHEIPDENQLESRLFAATMLMKTQSIEAIHAGIRALNDANRRRKISFESDGGAGAATPASALENCSERSSGRNSDADDEEFDTVDGLRTQGHIWSNVFQKIFKFSIRPIRFRMNWIFL